MHFFFKTFVLLSLAVTFVLGIDEITLTNGELVKGRLEDKRETATEILIDVSTMKGVSDFKTILKSEIASIKKSDGAEDPATKLEIPQESIEAKWYEEQIEKVLKPWIEKYPQSPLFAAVQQKLTDLTGELARVKAGDIKMSGKWYTRSEFEEVRIDVETLKFIDQVKDLVDRKDFSELLKVKSKIASYKASDHFGKLIEIFQTGFKEFQTGGYEEIIRKQVSDLEFLISQNEKFIREMINETIPSTTFVNDDVMDWDILRSSGPDAAMKRRSKNKNSTSEYSSTTNREFNASSDEGRYYVSFNGVYYRMSDVVAEWNKSDTVIAEFIKDFKAYYIDPNGPKYRISSIRMADARRLLESNAAAKEKVKTVNKESQSIGQFEDRIAKALAEIEGFKIENFARAKESLKAALLSHEKRDFAVTMSELRSASQVWPGLISVDRAVKQMVVDYFNESKEELKKGDFKKAALLSTNATQLIPLAKAKFFALVSLKTEINKFMIENKQMMEELKKQEEAQRKKAQDQKLFAAKFESDFNRGDYVALSKLDSVIMEGEENYQSFVDRKKSAEEGMNQSKELQQQIRPLIVGKKLVEAGDSLAKAKTLWPLNPGLSELNGLLAEAMKPRTFLDEMEDHMGITIGVLIAVFLGITYGVSRYLAK